VAGAARETGGLEHLRFVLLTGPGGLLPASGIEVRDLESELAEIVSCEPPHMTKSHDPAYLVYTSGTTGYPKGVLHGHRAMIGREPAAQYWFDFADDVANTE
jgi:acetyl-CoA synthetase